jgi:hypothetical protein
VPQAVTDDEEHKAFYLFKWAKDAGKAVSRDEVHATCLQAVGAKQ